ncbi:hypothetical protein [Variovorax sp. WS11]|uniref:hypothetical protein n=1 Tax=Variovorax sp. WS11 TaxID=1105204 RepID=UPI0013DCD2FD|nr:hypothetical protein [Variovorax sp. WS11]NDZ17087.1 hypothetical protein [Variovorax sp. WS11]
MTEDAAASLWDLDRDGGVAVNDRICGGLSHIHLLSVTRRVPTVAFILAFHQDARAGCIEGASPE